MNLQKKVKKTWYPKDIGNVGVKGESRREKGMKGEQVEKNIEVNIYIYISKIENVISDWMYFLMDGKLKN